MSDRQYDCPGAREAEAYEVQKSYAEAVGQKTMRTRRRRNARSPRAQDYPGRRTLQLAGNPAARP
jgi:hypothetical protein